MPVTHALLPRRAALAAGAGVVLAAAGCDGRGSTPTARPTGSTDPDTALVAEVVTALRRAERVAGAQGALELAALHRAHLEALEAAPAAVGGRPPKRGAAPVRRTEEALHRTLVRAAERAESGALARLLASMSAAVAQRLATPQGAA